MLRIDAEKRIKTVEIKEKKRLKIKEENQIEIEAEKWKKWRGR